MNWQFGELTVATRGWKPSPLTPVLSLLRTSGDEQLTLERGTEGSR